MTTNSPVRTTKRGIQYPMAYRQPFDVTHIEDAERGNAYLCLGCHRDMVPRKGKIKRHHFAHKAGPEQCNPDNALHETAKAAICQGFLRALRKGLAYPIRIPCDRCEDPFETNVAIEGAGIATERSEVRGTRSDLVITKEDGRSPRLIVEIVVHHDLESGTEEMYRASEIPVIKVKPSWETVDTLREEINSSETLNVSNPTCRRCRDKERRHGEWFKATEDQIKDVIRPNQGIQPKLERIMKDRYGSFLRADTRGRVNRNARMLAVLGFRQQNSRPTLFKVQIDRWSIYADIDSTEVMRIWEVDCAAGLYAFPQDAEPPRCRECVLDIVRGIVEENGVEIRRYFMDYGEHNHWNREMD